MPASDLFTETTQPSQTIFETASVTVFVSAIAVVVASAATAQNNVTQCFIAYLFVSGV